MKPVRMLFLYVSFSSGHQRAAEAIMEAFKRLYPKVETKGLNSFNYVSPGVEKIVGRTYLEMLKRTPQIWGYLYDNRSVVEATAEIRSLLSRLNSGKFKKLINSFSPDVVVCTQAAPCAVISNLKRKQHKSLKLIAVITDFKAHAYWICDNVDLYIVPTNEVKSDLIKQGIDKDSIKVLGIPVDPKFQSIVAKTKARQNLKLNSDLTTILVMGGGQGFGPIKEILGELSLIKTHFQVIIIAGRNKKLYRSLRKMHKKFPFPVNVMGFTKRIEKVMDAADVIITKPGGMTASEALVKGLPMIIVDPIPGQEERNSQFLVKQKVALRIDDISDIHKIITELLHPSSILKQMSMRALDLSKPNAARDCSQVIMNLVDYKRLFVNITK